MNLRFTTTLLALLACSSLHAQSLQWVKALNDASVAVAVSELASGDVIIAGNFSDTVDMDPGTATAQFIPEGSTDIYITKLDANGNWQWTKAISSTSPDEVRDMVTDASGNIYVTGTYYNTVDFDPGAGTANLTSAGGRDNYLLKLDAAGNYQWAISIGSSGFEYVYTLLLKNSGNILVGGAFNGKTDFDPATGAADTVYRTPLASSPIADIFLAEYTAAGAFVRVGTISGPNSKSLSDLAEDNAGSVYCTGGYSVAVDVDPAETTSFQLSTTGIANTFIMKMDANGAFQWAKDFEVDTAYAFGAALDLDANGNIYVVGRISDGRIDFNSSTAPADTAVIVTTPIQGLIPGHSYICKLDAAGQFKWVRVIRGVSQASAIEVEPGGNFYLAGAWSGKVDLDLSEAPNDTAFAETGPNPYDHYHSYLIYGSSSGNTLWWGTVGRSELYGGYTGIAGLHLGTNHLYACGGYERRTDLDPGADSLMFESNNTQYKAWVFKWDPVPVSVKDPVQNTMQASAWPNPSAAGSYDISLGQHCSHLSLNVYNSNGQQVAQHNYRNTDKIRLQLNTAPGIYFAVITDEKGQVYTTRLLK